MHKPARSLGQRIVWACVILALLCASLFSFFNVIFVYTVEDQFFRHQLMDEEKRQLQQPELVVPLSAAMQILLSPQDFPADLQQQFEPNTRRTEYSGLEGRHYHIRSLFTLSQRAGLVSGRSQFAAGGAADSG